jgi:hypothetical protein
VWSFFFTLKLEYQVHEESTMLQANLQLTSSLCFGAVASERTPQTGSEKANETPSSLLHVKSHL